VLASEALILSRFRSVVVALALPAALLITTSPARAAGEFSVQSIPLAPGSVVGSLTLGQDGNLWFSTFDIVGGRVGYIVRLQPSGATTYYRLSNFSRPGSFSRPTMPVGLANFPGPLFRLGPRGLVFNWIVYDPTTQAINESGLGTFDFDNPTQIREYAAQYPGDPLYSPTFELEPFSWSIATSSTFPSPNIYSYAHARLSSPTSPELIATIPFPFHSLSAMTTFATSKPAYGCCSPDALINGNDGNAWFDDYYALGQVGRTGARAFPLPGIPEGLAPASSSVWAALLADSGFSVDQISYSGAIEASYPLPYLGIDFFILATGPDAVWGMSRNDYIPAVYFMRLAPSGQWSAYEVPNSLGKRLTTATSMQVAPDGTVWMAIAEAQWTADLLGLRTNRVLSTESVAVSLSSGESATIVAHETNYAAKFFAASVPSSYCPLSVTAGPDGGFMVTATSNMGYGPCGVTISDGTGISVWVPVTLPEANVFPAAVRRQMLAKFPRPHFFSAR
jgi:hypothetical protein